MAYPPRLAGIRAFGFQSLTENVGSERLSFSLQESPPRAERSTSRVSRVARLRARCRAGGARPRSPERRDRADHRAAGRRARPGARPCAARGDAGHRVPDVRCGLSRPRARRPGAAQRGAGLAVARRRHLRERPAAPDSRARRAARLDSERSLVRELRHGPRAAARAAAARRHAARVAAGAARRVVRSADSSPRARRSRSTRGSTGSGRAS